MADNSNSRRKTLIVSMLAFLLVGGGVFLFFIIQGSNDLTSSGKKNNFHYGGAAREGVTSFFKAIGIVPDEEELLAQKKEVRMKARGFLPDGTQAGVVDVSDWMASNSAAAPSGRPSRAGATAVPRMEGGSRSSAGGSGGGSKSAGGVSRFGDGAVTGNAVVSAKAQAGFGVKADKGTLGALKNARAMLGEGLKSNSAMTASSKWGQSFGAGGSSGGGGGKSGGDLAYGKAGLVKLDNIKSGEIASLKKAPEASAFKRDKDAEGKDENLKDLKEKASDKSKEDAKAKEKEAIAKSLVDAAGQGMEKGLSGGGDTKGGPESGPKEEVTETEREQAASMLIPPETNVNAVRNSDGGATYTYVGPGDPPEYEDVVIRAKDGTLTFITK
ncbi:MAG: hypothetical protein Q7R35_08695 [Elusimicrobiota bacterium]|nr:hypothetical protein [Elusimicrobiota bacterium]